MSIEIVMDHLTERLRVSPKLAELIDVHLDTKPRILMGLWQYIKVTHCVMIYCFKDILLSLYLYSAEWAARC